MGNGTFELRHGTTSRSISTMAKRQSTGALQQCLRRTEIHSSGITRHCKE